MRAHEVSLTAAHLPFSVSWALLLKISIKFTFPTQSTWRSGYSFASYLEGARESWLLHWQLAVKYFHSGFRCTFPQTIAESTASFSSLCLMGWAISVGQFLGWGIAFLKIFATGATRPGPPEWVSDSKKLRVARFRRSSIDTATRV